jgi:hypothetical protein
VVIGRENKSMGLFVILLIVIVGLLKASFVMGMIYDINPCFFLLVFFIIAYILVDYFSNESEA